MSSDKEDPSLSTTKLAYSTPEHAVLDFASRGLLILAPESLGVPLDVHARVYKK